MINKVIQLLSDATNVSIYSHINTDCDAIGSSLALREVLLSMGKNVDVFVNSDFPSSFSYYGDLSFINQKTCTEKYDLAVCVDCATEGRLGKYKYSYRKGVKNTLCIDHHTMSNEKYCKTNYIRESSSTCEILFEIFSQMNVFITEDLARILLSGILTDTGKLTHSATSKTFATVSKLLKYGKIKIEDVTTPLFNSMSINVFNLIKRAYEKIEFYADKKLAVIMFSQEDYKETETKLDDIDAIPDIPLQIDDVKFCIVASEDDQGYFRVSFRSKGELSSRAVAETFGGGGHLNASGCKIFGSFDEVKQQLLTNTFEVLGWKNDN